MKDSDNKEQLRLIIGKNCVLEALKHAPRRVKQLLIVEDKERAEYEKLAKAKGIKIRYVHKQLLEKLASSDSHQGVAAYVTAEWTEVKDFLKTLSNTEEALVLMLDSIFDPQNVGALLRASECFGVKGVVFSKNRGAEITPAVSKVSVGATELLPLIRVSNLVDAIRKFQDEGFEVVVAAVDDKAKPLTSFQFSKKTLIIVGSEGKGVQPLVIKQADRKVYIPMKGKIDSLNVSQAASVMIYEYSRQSHL